MLDAVWDRAVSNSVAYRRSWSVLGGVANWGRSFAAAPRAVGSFACTPCFGGLVLTRWLVQGALAPSVFLLPGQWGYVTLGIVTVVAALATLTLPETNGQAMPDVVRGLVSRKSRRLLKQASVASPDAVIRRSAV